MVTDLIQHIESHILSHPDKFIIQFLSLTQDRQDLNTDQYEDIISMHLPDYIQDDKLLSLHFTTLYRIVAKYQLKPDISCQSKIIEFLFKCLDKYGRKASALFEKIDFMKEDAIYLRRLKKMIVGLNLILVLLPKLIYILILFVQTEVLRHIGIILNRGGLKVQTTKMTGFYLIKERMRDL